MGAKRTDDNLDFLVRAGLDREEIEVVQAMQPRKGDGWGEAAARACDVMDRRAGCGLYDIAHWHTVVDIVRKLSRPNKILTNREDNNHHTGEQTDENCCLWEQQEGKEGE
jgi:hypothetical protein